MSKRNSLSKYLDEALGLGMFMISAGFFDMIVENPQLPLREHLQSAFLRRALIGLSMGLTALFIFTSRFGKASGAYINPSVTIVRFFRHEISFVDGIFYIIFQFIGGTLGMFLIYALFPSYVSAPSVNYVITAPGPQGLVVAFAGELVISFLLIVVVLLLEKSRFSRYTSFAAAILIWLFVIFEAPLSGMSMNPARTFSSAIVGNNWSYFWLYCLAPTLAMMTGAFVCKAMPLYHKESQNETRRQLTLFVTDNVEIIEKIRREFNPIQHRLISAHVTICREDEIEPIDTVIENIRSINKNKPIKIMFDSVERFENGKGVLIPAATENNEFHDLRKIILRGVNDSPRKHRPHITLMHPRNSTCTDSVFDQIRQYKLPTELRFDKISLIEQKCGGEWTILEEFPIVNKDT